jgi:sugar transferase (PEP-CTERM/EpsH1 system associated)
MRILILSPELPYPPAWGFAIRVSQIVALLARRHAVSLLTYAADQDGVKIKAMADLRADIHAVPARHPQWRWKRLPQLLSTLSSRSYQGRYLYSDAMQRKLDELCAGQPFDIIQVETSQMAAFDFDPRSALVIDEHDIVFELLDRIAASERSWLRRLYNGAEARKYRHEEIERWRRAGACVVTSSREVPIVRRAGVTGPILTAPNGVDVAYFAPGTEPPEPDTLVMTGLMRTRPNIDGAAFFVRDVLPAILTHRPNARLFIVGGDPPDEITRLAGDHVVVTGGVPDVRPYLRQAAVAVVPLRMGGGTRLKVLEALSMKKPMVTTSLGCEGIDVRHEEHLLVADDPAGFAQAVVRLLDEPDTGARLAENGHALVHARYRWENVVERLEVLYEELLRARSRPQEPLK